MSRAWATGRHPGVLVPAIRAAALTGPCIHLAARALKQAPGHVPALCGRGKVQCQLNNMTMAQDLFRAALRLAPHDWPTLTNYGVMLVRHVGDTDNGERLLERACAVAPNPSLRQMLGDGLKRNVYPSSFAISLTGGRGFALMAARRLRCRREEGELERGGGVDRMCKPCRLRASPLLDAH